MQFVCGCMKLLVDLQKQSEYKIERKSKIRCLKNCLLPCSFSLSVNGFTIAHAFETNGLEDVGGQEIPVSGNSVNVTLKPFQIRSFLFTWEL